MRRSIFCIPRTPTLSGSTGFCRSGPGRQTSPRRIPVIASLLIAGVATVVSPVLSEASRIADSARRDIGLTGGPWQERSGDTLERGKPVTRELSGDETHSYRIMLEAGQYLRATFDQRGINLIIALYGPDGGKIADLDSPVGAHGPEPVSLIAETSGSYRLEARPWQKNLPKGRYEVRIEEIRAATPQDRTRVTAERGFAEATIISGQGTGEALRKAIEKYGEVIPLWQALGDRRQEAYTLIAIGYFNRNLGEFQKALECFNRVLPLSRAAGDRSGESMALYQLGLVHSVLGEPQKALDFYDKAQAMYRADGDSSMQAAALGNMGAVYSGLGEQHKALEAFNQALPIKREANDLAGVATLLNNIGLVHSYLGEHQKALDLFNQALAIHRTTGNRREEATTLNNIAKIYDDFGEHQKALEFYLEVAQIKREAGIRNEEAIALNNVGYAHGSLGDHRKALGFYNRSLTLSRATGDRSAQAATLNNIGKAHSSLGEHRLALDFYNEALSNRRAVGDRRGEAITLTNIGRAWHDSGEPRRALDHYNQALSLNRDVSDRRSESITLYNIARARRDLDDLAEARTRIEASLAIIESLRTKVASQALRASYLASFRQIYELGIDILMRSHKQRPSEGFAALALQTSERARARTLLELLTEARSGIRQGVAPELIERERSLGESLDARATAQMRLLSGRHTPEQAAAAAREIDDLTNEYEHVQARIRQTSPRYAALTQPVPLSLEQIQTEVLDDQTLLLEYTLGEERSYLWAVTTSSIDSFELPKRAEIEAAARRVYEILTARNLSASNGPSQQARAKLAEFPEASAVLSRMLLGPVAARLNGRRLLIVSEGLLQYLPFTALPVPGGKSPGYRPMIVEHEIISLPSASVLAVLRRETTGRKPAARTIAVLADPVFYRDDPRIVSPGVDRAQTVGMPVSDVNRSATESGLADFVRLRFSRQEAENITRHATEDRKLKALDFDASRATASSEELGRYAIIHFATHGLINNRHPELSGIVLSLVDEKGQPQDGFLRLHEIYNLRLGADLVVLSACQTALGKEIRGEGLIGLTRGFMYAGAPRVVASLWRIDDRATAEFMKRFYEAMLGQGRRPAAALRTAQLSLLGDKRWREPYYWAAFTLQGEWK